MNEARPDMSATAL